jgi:hypothetical protein
MKSSLSAHVPGRIYAADVSEWIPERELLLRPEGRALMYGEAMAAIASPMGE